MADHVSSIQSNFKKVVHGNKEENMNKLPTIGKPTSPKIKKQNNIYKYVSNVTMTKPKLISVSPAIQTVQATHNCPICKKKGISMGDLLKHKTSHLDEIIAAFSNYLSSPSSIKCDICSKLIKTLPLVILEIEETKEQSHGLCQFDRLVKSFEDHKYENVNCDLYTKIISMYKTNGVVCSSESTSNISKTTEQPLSKELVLADHTYNIKTFSRPFRPKLYKPLRYDPPPENVKDIRGPNFFTSKFKIESTKLSLSKKRIAINNKTASTVKALRANKLFKQFGDATSTDSSNLYSTIFRENYDCYVCGKKCSNKRELETHKVVHINDYRIYPPELHHGDINHRKAEKKNDHSKILKLPVRRSQSKRSPQQSSNPTVVILSNVPKGNLKMYSGLKKKYKTKKLHIVNEIREMDSSVIVDFISKCHISNNDTVDKIIDVSKTTNGTADVRNDESKVLTGSDGVKENAICPTQKAEEIIVIDDEDHDDCILLENDKFDSTSLNEDATFKKNQNLDHLICKLIGSITDVSTESNAATPDEIGAPTIDKNESTVKDSKDKVRESPTALPQTPDKIETEKNSSLVEHDDAARPRPLSGDFEDNKLSSEFPEEDKSTFSNKNPPSTGRPVDDLIHEWSDSIDTACVDVLSDEEEENAGKSAIAQINSPAETFNSIQSKLTTEIVWNDDFQSDDDMSIQQELIKEINDIMEIDLNDDCISASKEHEEILANYLYSNVLDVHKDFANKGIKADLDIGETELQGSSSIYDTDTLLDVKIKSFDANAAERRVVETTVNKEDEQNELLSNNNDELHQLELKEFSKDLDGDTKNLPTNKQGNERKRKGKEKDVSLVKNYVKKLRGMELLNGNDDNTVKPVSIELHAANEQEKPKRRGRPPGRKKFTTVKSGHVLVNASLMQIENVDDKNIQNKFKPLNSENKLYKKKPHLPAGRMLRFNGIQLKCLMCIEDSEVMDTMYCFSCDEQFYTTNAFNYHIKTSFLHKHTFKSDVVKLFKWKDENLAQTTGDCELREDDVFTFIKELLRLNTFDDLHTLDTEYQSASNAAMGAIDNLAEKRNLFLKSNCRICDVTFSPRSHRVFCHKDKTEWYKKKSFFFRKIKYMGRFKPQKGCNRRNPNVSSFKERQNKPLNKIDISIDQQIVDMQNIKNAMEVKLHVTYLQESQPIECENKTVAESKQNDESAPLNDVASGSLSLVESAVNAELHPESYTEAPLTRNFDLIENNAGKIGNESLQIRATPEDQSSAHDESGYRLRPRTSGNVPIEQSDNSIVEGECRICIKMIAHTETFRHIRHHIGNRPNICYICHKAFAYGSSLLRHNQLTNHKGYSECFGSSCAPKSNFLLIEGKHYHKDDMRIKKHSCCKNRMQ